MKVYKNKFRYGEFMAICREGFGYAIAHFHHHAGAYFVIVYGGENETAKFAQYLNNLGISTTFYQIHDPNNEYNFCYEIMAYN